MRMDDKSKIGMRFSLIVGSALLMVLISAISVQGAMYPEAKVIVLPE